MGYAFIPLVVSVGLGFRYVMLRNASRRSKLGVAATVTIALVIGWRFSQSLWLATLLQVAVSVYVLVYLKASSRVR
jgi:hypothetical protein